MPVYREVAPYLQNVLGDITKQIIIYKKKNEIPRVRDSDTVY